jgi:hypothetical protein
VSSDAVRAPAPEPLEGRRKRLTRLLSRSNKAICDGIQLSEAITGDGAAIFRHACGLGLEGIVSKRIGLAVHEWADTCMAQDEEPEFRGRVIIGPNVLERLSSAAIICEATFSGVMR